MKDNKNIVQRALDYDLNEEELADFYGTQDRSTSQYNDALAEQLVSDLFIPEKAKLLAAKRKELEGLMNKPKSKRIALPLRLLGIAAGVIALVGMLVLMQPSSGEITEEMIQEFSELAREAYSPEVLASLERSDEVSEPMEQVELVRAYESADYEFVLENTSGEGNSGELRLLRARVLMDLGRYAEGLEIVEGIDAAELVQRDVWLWMRAEGELGVGNSEAFKNTLDEIIEMRLPGYEEVFSN